VRKARLEIVLLGAVLVALTGNGSASSTWGASDRGDIRVEVRDLVTHEPIGCTRVEVMGWPDWRYTALTDSTGSVCIRAFPKGGRHVSLQREGYADSVFLIDVQPVRGVRLKCALRRVSRRIPTCSEVLNRPVPGCVSPPMEDTAGVVLHR
jgi:hypothetical protein